jgi:signal peptidase
VGPVVGAGVRVSAQPQGCRPIVAGDGDDAMGDLSVADGYGDDVADAGWVKPVQVKGQVWYAVPQLGRLHAALSEREHRQLVYLTAAALLAFAAAMCAGAVRDRHVAATQVRVGGATGTGRGES